MDLLVGFPVPGQEFMEAWIGNVIDPCQDIGEPCLGIDMEGSKNPLVLRSSV